MLIALTIITIFFYMSLFVELFYYSIPSVVATKKILYPNLKDSDYFSEYIRKILNWSYTKKILVFVAPMAFVYLLHILPAYFIYDINFNNRNLKIVSVLFYTGILLVSIGRIVSHLYLRSVKKIKAKSFEGFVVSGVYKFSRNPGLVGLYVSFFGFLIIQPSLLFLTCFIIYIVHMHFKIIMEEDFLTNKHGDDYKRYLQKTRRYL